MFWKRLTAPSAHSLILLLLVAVVSAGVGAAAAWQWRTADDDAVPFRPTAGQSLDVRSASQSAEASPSSAAERIAFPQSQWAAAGLKLDTVQRSPLQTTMRLTGKVALDEDRLAHIAPLVEGRVHEVHVRFGQRVRRGDLLVTVQSREVGEAQLALHQDRLLLESARQKDRWTQEVAGNVQRLIDALEQQQPIDAIERQFRDRRIGEYREQLMSAYVARIKSAADLQRLSSLTESQAVAAKNVRAAEAQYDADRARLQAMLEQTGQDARHSTLLSSQAVAEAQTRVAIAEAGLHMLGFDRQQLADRSSDIQADAISLYPIVAPFDGTIISKDVVLLERVDPAVELLRIADLSSVWIATDIYEQHLSLLQDLPDRTLYVSSPVWPDRRFEAKVFYTGEIVDESTRTIAMRAVADNAEGLLKPGMFVNVEIVLQEDDAEVLQVPAEAILNHDGDAFVFVSGGGGEFEKRDVTLGREADQGVEIVAGLEPGESVVVAGGFALKSKLLESLMAGD